MKLQTGDKIEYILGSDFPQTIKAIFLGFSNIRRSYLSNEAEKIACVQVKGNINSSLVPLSLINKV